LLLRFIFLPRLAMNASFRVPSAAVLLCASLLSGCAGVDTVRGRLNYDLRPPEARTDVLWPLPPDAPRYRYVGELIGQPNFDQADLIKKQNVVFTALKWFAGLFDTDTNQILLQRPQHGAVSDNGRIYVVDAGRNAVLVFDPNAPPEEKSADAGGQMLLWEFADATTRFVSPIAVALVWNGDIAVSDAKLGIVVRLNEKGQPVGKLGAGQLQRPTGLAFDRERGLLFVADTVANDIKVYDRIGQLVNTIGAAGDRDGEFNAPTHLAFTQGHLYVSDTLNSRVQVFDSDGHRIRELGERGLFVGNFTRPKGVAVDDNGIVYVVESYFGHLLAYNKHNEFLLGINGSGLKDGDFLLPSGVWVDHQGRIFVADMFNGRVVVFQFLGNQDN
jgi:sugar lactone lactonase YvrE